jgi:hypothetical protein
MKSFFAVAAAAFAPLVAAHYTLPQITINGVLSAAWQYTRTTANHYR